MIEVLLAIIAACVLFGSAAVLGFLGVVFWLILFLAVVLLVVLAVRAVVKGAIGIVCEAGDSLSRPRHRKIKTPDGKSFAPPNIRGVHFADFEDYLDWANHTGQWTPEQQRQQDREQQERDRRAKTKPPPKIDGVTFSDWQDYLDWANREGRWREGTDVAQDGCAGSGEGLRPGIDGEVIPSNVMPPDMAARVRKLLREHPDQRDDILDELRWNGWRVEGL
jgi:hypothetical protein